MADAPASQAMLQQALIKARSYGDRSLLGPHWAPLESQWPSAVPALPFAPSHGFASCAGSCFLRFGVFCRSEISLTKLGDRERNEIGLGNPSGVNDRFM